MLIMCHMQVKIIKNFQQKWFSKSFEWKEYMCIDGEAKIGQSKILQN